MSEIPALLAKAQRYLRSADLLFQDGDYESCISRAYYAMFYCAQAALLTRSLTFSSLRALSQRSENTSSKPAYSRSRWEGS